MRTPSAAKVRVRYEHMTVGRPGADEPMCVGELESIIAECGG